MGTRFLFTTETKIGTHTIQLKHKGLWLGKGEAQNITRQLARARLMLSSTIAAVSGGNGDSDFARTYFTDVPTATEWQNVLAKLELIYGGLNADVTLKLGGDGALGYVKRSEVSPTATGAVLFPDGKYWSREGHTIHVSKKRMELRGEELAVVTIIHEASHKFANTFDHDNRAYRRRNDSNWLAPGLTKPEALINADSYGYFVYRQGASMGA
jgi:hypothetical protein